MSSLAFSDFGSDDGEHSHTNGHGYSTLMDELFGDEDETAPTSPLRFDKDEDDEDEEPFVYDGADAPISRASYREQLRDVLDDDEIEEREVERSLVHDSDHSPMTIGDEALVSFPAATLYSMLISRDSHTTPTFSPSCAWHGDPTQRATIESALDDVHSNGFPFPLFPLRLHLRIPRLSPHNVLLPPKRNPHRPLNSLTSLLALPAPDDLAPPRLHATRHIVLLPLRDERTFRLARYLTFARPVDLLHAFSRLVHLRAPGRRCGEARSSEWARLVVVRCARGVQMDAVTHPRNASFRPTPLKQGASRAGRTCHRLPHGHGRKRARLHRHGERADTRV